MAYHPLIVDRLSTIKSLFTVSAVSSLFTVSTVKLQGGVFPPWRPAPPRWQPRPRALRQPRLRALLRAALLLPLPAPALPPLLARALLRPRALPGRQRALQASWFGQG